MIRTLLARLAYRLLRPELDELYDPALKAHRELLAMQREQLRNLEAMADLVGRPLPTFPGFGGLARH